MATNSLAGTSKAVTNPSDLRISQADVDAAKQKANTQAIIDRIKAPTSKSTGVTPIGTTPTKGNIATPIGTAPQTSSGLNQLTSSTKTPGQRISVPTSKQVTYYDPTGNKQSGYIIDGLTYSDPYGKNRIGVGSMVESGGGWYELTDNGGVKIDAPYINNGKAEKLTPGPVNQFDLENFMTPKENELYGLIDTLTQSFMNMQPTQTMSMDEATARATAQLRQPFEQNLEETMKSYDQSAIQRGMFGQQPVEALKRDAMANVELAEQSAVQDLAGDIYQQDFEIGQSKDAQAFNIANQKLESVRNVLFDEKSKKQEIQSAQAAISSAQSDAQKQTVESAYDRWNALGYADEVVANALGIDVGTQSQGNMEESVKNQYAMALEEYKGLLAVQQAQAEYGFDISLAGYKSGLNLNEAIQKAQLDLTKMAQAANLDLQTDVAKMAYEYDFKKDYESFLNDMITPDLKFELFEKAIDMSGVDQDKKDMAIQIIQSKAGQEYDGLSLEDALKEYDTYFKDTDINKIMDSYNGLLNIVGSEGIDAGLNIPESDYGDIYSGSNPLRGTGQQQ